MTSTPDLYDSDAETEAALDLQEKMAARSRFAAVKANCLHAEIVRIITGDSDRVVCSVCEAEFVEKDYLVEAVSRIEASQGRVESIAAWVRQYIEPAFEQMKSGPLGKMLGL